MPIAVTPEQLAIAESVAQVGHRVAGAEGSRTDAAAVPGASARKTKTS